MKLNYKKYIGAVALIWLPCFMLLAIFYLLIVRPQNRKRSDVEGKLTETRRLCEAAETVMQEKGRAELNRQLDQFLAKIRDYAIDEKGSTDVTFAISKIANEKKVTDFNIRTADNQPASANSNKYIYEKRISVDFTSGFNQFAGFLNALERYQPVIFVNDFRMVRSNENPLGHKFNMGLVVLVRKRVE